MTNSPKETSAEEDFACEMKQHAMIEEAIASAGLAEEDTTPAGDVELVGMFYKEKGMAYRPTFEELFPFIRKTRAEAVKEAIDYIYTNLPFTTDRMENLVVSKEKMREVLEKARGV